MFMKRSRQLKLAAAGITFRLGDYTDISSLELASRRDVRAAASC
jgi:hypothetical protein